MSKAGIKGTRMWEHQPEARWAATVVQPHKKGEPGSDLPFKVKCVMNKCIVGFFFLRVVIPDHFPLPATNIDSEEREQTRGSEREWVGRQEQGELPETTVSYKPLVL